MHAFTHLSLLLAGSAAGFTLVGCGMTDSRVGSLLGAVQGQACADEGAASEAMDGCNACTCVNGAWACSSNPCDEPCTPEVAELAPDGCNSCSCDEDGRWVCTRALCAACQSGTLRPVGDGCNICTCTDGAWACTADPCEACAAPRDPGNDTCASVETLAMDPATGSCCRYASVCRVPDAMQRLVDEATCFMRGGGMAGATGMGQGMMGSMGAGGAGM